MANDRPPAPPASDPPDRPQSAAPGPDPLRQAYRSMLEEVGLDLPFADHRPTERPNPFASGPYDPQAAADLLKYNASVRRYTTWPSVATEPPVNFMHRLATVKQQSLLYLGDRLPHSQRVLDAQMDEVRTWLDRQGIRLPCPVLAGLYPTGQLNARAVPVPGSGALLLVNVGLMDLIFMLLKINLATRAEGDAAPPLLDDDQVVKAFTDVFNAYLYGQGSLGAWALPRLPEERERPLGFVLRRAEQFVLCHEIGHVALGHVSPERTEKRHAVGDYTPEQENDADAFAIDLMLRAHKDDPGWELRSPYLAGAVMTFFAIADAIRILEGALNRSEQLTESHPALSNRMNRAAARLSAALPDPNLLGPAGVFTSWLLTSLPEVIGWFALIDEVMVRPGAYD